MRAIVALFVVLFAFVSGATPALADKRVALLIGNGSYTAVPALANPRNDAKLLKSALESAGFDDVRVAFDLGQKPMLKALNAFADAAAGADIAVIYYSGHGLEVGGVNYLVPVDARLATDTDVADQTVTLDRMMQALDGAKRLKLVILDACRTNPFLASIKVKNGRRAIENGLAPVEPAGPDTLVAFAAKAGTPAFDGGGDNSPFAAALASRLVAPGDDVEIVLRKVRDDVLAATHNEQEPFKYGSLGGSVISLAKAQPDSGGEDRQAAYDAAMGAGTVEALEGFLTKYPDGGLAKSARRERERQVKLAAIVPKPPPAPTGPCGGVTSASLASRAVGALTADETCALRRGDVFKECVDCPEMVVVPEGSFTMGSPGSELGRSSDEGPRRDVKIARAFAVGKFHVTKDEFAAFVRETGYDAGSKCYSFANSKWEEISGHSWRDPGFPQSSSHPAVCSSWDDAQAYVIWLKGKTGRSYRLLSESEWEYSARGQTSPGTYPQYFFGDSEKDFCMHGNGADETTKTQVPGASSWAVLPCSDGYAYTSPVGVFMPNRFGLYDMLGNVWQWVQDCYSDSYQGAANEGSPIVSGDCSRRVIRGGSWFVNPRGLRAAQRNKIEPAGRSYNLGFRVARTLLP